MSIQSGLTVHVSFCHVSRLVLQRQCQLGPRDNLWRPMSAGKLLSNRLVPTHTMWPGHLLRDCGTWQTYWKLHSWWGTRCQPGIYIY